MPLIVTAQGALFCLFASLVTISDLYIIYIYIYIFIVLLYIFMVIYTRISKCIAVFGAVMMPEYTKFAYFLT